MNRLIFLFIACAFLSAEIIPPNRRIAWDPGMPGGIPNLVVKANVMDYGAAADGSTDDAQAFRDAIAAVTDGGVLVPAGNYMLRSRLGIGKSVVLRGQGPDRTHLTFELASDAYGIEIVTYQRGAWDTVQAGYTFGSTQLTVTNGSRFTAGGFAEILRDNDSAVMYTNPLWDEPWADNSIGQIVKVTAVAGNALTVDPPLRHTYSANLYPRIRSQGFVQNAGVEDMHIQLNNAGDPATIQIKNAAYCWVRNCHLENTVRTHVSFSTAFRCEVRYNYMHHAHDYGGGGHGYGVNAGGRTSDCLIEDNIFEHLRHSMLVQTGANGNVFGYNYSIDNYTDASWTPCDISLHGHWPYMNLFEGNVVQEIDVSDYWGPCGPGNTFLRNRIETEGFDVFDHSHGQNFVGNELPVDDVDIDATVNNTLVHGNHVFGSIQWDNTISDHTVPVSYYHTSKPAFFGSIGWPVTGGDLVPDTGWIPAQVRYLGGSPFKAEAGMLRQPVTVECRPNPFHTAVVITVHHGPVGATRRVAPTLAMYDVHGRMVHRARVRQPGKYLWNVEHLPAGIYLLKCRAGGRTVTRRVVLMK
jgi:hypothetical protein